MAFTAQVLDPGAVYFDERRARLITVPDSHYAVRCLACAYTVNLPTRQGRDRAEETRRAHLLSAHLTALRTGAVVLTETPPLFDVAFTAPATIPATVDCVAVQPAGAVNGTVEQDEPRLVAGNGSAPEPSLDGPELAPPGRHFARPREPIEATA